MRKKILICNDDGIEAEGIITLANVLSAVSDIVVVAPDRERSASSHSLTIFSPLSYEKKAFPNRIDAYAVSGTPADCVKFGLAKIVRDVDLVISGINRGANLGSDIMYSGTVSAAREAAYLGQRAMAVSVASYTEPSRYYLQAAEFIKNNLDELLGIEIDSQTILNINYPIAPNGVRGVRFGHMGIQEYDDIYLPHDINLDEFYLRGEPIGHERNRPESDVEFCGEGYITITPITIDMTNYDALRKASSRSYNWKK